MRREPGRNVKIFRDHRQNGNIVVATLRPSAVSEITKGKVRYIASDPTAFGLFSLERSILEQNCGDKTYFSHPRE